MIHKNCKQLLITFYYYFVTIFVESSWLEIARRISHHRYIGIFIVNDNEKLIIFSYSYHRNCVKARNRNAKMVIKNSISVIISRLRDRTDKCRDDCQRREKQTKPAEKWENERRQTKYEKERPLITVKYSDTETFRFYIEPWMSIYKHTRIIQ